MFSESLVGHNKDSLCPLQILELKNLIVVVDTD